MKRLINKRCVKWLSRHSMFIVLNIHTTHFSIMLYTYKYTSRNTYTWKCRWLNIRSEAPYTYIITSNVYALYTCMYYIIYVAVTYTLLYTYICVIYASHDIRMYYKFKVSTRDVKCVHILCTSFLELLV